MKELILILNLIPEYQYNLSGLTKDYNLAKFHYQTIWIRRYDKGNEISMDKKPD